MLRKRIIPIVLLDGFSVLKTINFELRRNLGSPVTVARTYNTRNVDELILLDIDATKQDRAIDKFTIAEIANDCFMPLTVGGGIKTIKDIEQLLVKGADKVAINSMALKKPSFIREASSIFGAQCIVVSIDVVEIEDSYKIFSNGMILNQPTLLEWVKKVENLGAGELLINNVTRDGSMNGANFKLSTLISSTVRIPVIYAGGVKSPQDACKLLHSDLSAVGISSIFHFTNYTPQDCCIELALHGIPARQT